MAESRFEHDAHIAREPTPVAKKGGRRPPERGVRMQRGAVYPNSPASAPKGRREGAIVARVRPVEFVGPLWVNIPPDI